MNHITSQNNCFCFVFKLIATVSFCKTKTFLKSTHFYPSATIAAQLFGQEIEAHPLLTPVLLTSGTMLTKKISVSPFKSLVCDFSDSLMVLVTLQSQALSNTDHFSVLKKRVTFPSSGKLN